MAKALRKVHVYGPLRDWADRHQQDIAHLVEEFAHWKAMSDEHGSWYFGKDGFYTRPTRNNRSVLRHVHMPPAERSPKFKQWERAWASESRKISDTILVYAEDPRHGFLLLHIVLEPDGHDFGDMLTPADRSLMKVLADAAEAFIHDGTVDVAEA